MKKKITIISIIFLMIVTVAYVPKEFQNDTFYLVKAGESLMQNGIDFADHFSFHNLSYLYPHFLFSIVVYLSYAILSFDGLYILTLIFSILLSLVMYYANIKNSNNKVIPLVITIIFLIYIYDFLTLRAQIISYSIFILEYYFLNKLITTNKNKYILYIFLLAILLVNTHVAVYPFYVILFLPIIGEYIINKILRKKTYSIKKILISLVFSLIAGLISPLFLNSYTYLYNTLINTTTKYIQEHQPIILFENPRAIIILLIVIILFTNKIFKLELKEKFLLLGLTIMALSSSRHQSLLSIFLFIILSKYLSIIIDKENIKLLEKNIIKTKGFIFALILILILSIPSFIKNMNLNYINENLYPVEATKYIKENLDYENIRIFNDIDIGSYLILNDIKVFIDSRTDLYTKSYNKKEDIFNNYINTIYFRVHYEIMFDSYDIDYILLPTDSTLSLYMSYGNSTSLYTVEYSDENFILYKRNILE